MNGGWEQYAALVGLVALAQGASLAAMKWMMARFTDHLEHRLASIERSSSALDHRSVESDRAVLKLREELARDYVRREDWIRLAVGLEAKLDGLWDALDQIKEKIHGRS